MTYDQIKQKIEAEASLPPGKRTQAVPCAYCKRGGNGDRSCAWGSAARTFSKLKSCFAGTLLDNPPGPRRAKAGATKEPADDKTRQLLEKVAKLAGTDTSLLHTPLTPCGSCVYGGADYGDLLATVEDVEGAPVALQIAGAVNALVEIRELLAKELGSGK